MGAGHILKRWPLKFLPEIANWLEKKMNCGLITFFRTMKSTRKMPEIVIAKAELQQGINLTGKLPLNVTAAFMRYLHGFIGNDSGPLHLAIAAGIPVIGIYGPRGSWPLWSLESQRTRRHEESSRTCQSLFLTVFLRNEPLPAKFGACACPTGSLGNFPKTGNTKNIAHLLNAGSKNGQNSSATSSRISDMLPAKRM